jgi:hypothetical protein
LGLTVVTDMRCSLDGRDQPRPVVHLLKESIRGNHNRHCKSRARLKGREK